MTHKAEKEENKKQKNDIFRILFLRFVQKEKYSGQKEVRSGTRRFRSVDQCPFWPENPPAAADIGGDGDGLRRTSGGRKSHLERELRVSLSSKKKQKK